MQNEKRWRPVRRNVVGAAVLVSGSFLFCRPSRAALVINLEFADGSTSMPVSPINEGQYIPVLVYGTVVGSNAVTTTPGATTGNFDGLEYVYYNIQSRIGANGGVAGGISTGATNSSYAPQLNGSPASKTGFAANGSQAGTVHDINGDGITDLGSSSVISQVAKPRYNVGVFDNAPSSSFGNQTIGNPTGAPDIIVGGTGNNSVSFLLETVYFQVGSTLAAGQITSLDPVPFSVNSPYIQTNYFADSPTTVVGSVPTKDVFSVASAGTSVQFTGVPEPACLPVAVVAGMMLRRRARRIARNSQNPAHASCSEPPLRI